MDMGLDTEARHEGLDEFAFAACEATKATAPQPGIGPRLAPKPWPRIPSDDVAALDAWLSH